MMMKKFAICLVLVTITLVLNHAEATEGTTNLHPGVVDPCQGPDASKIPGCQKGNGPRQEANEYNRGCSDENQCRQENQ
ncbi:conserved hypothetical protein, partial [Ricinus communis]